MIFEKDFGTNRDKKRPGERGSALVYILIAIALLAALTVAFMEPSSQQSQSQNTFKLISEIDSQADFIRSSAQECVLTYPGGDGCAIGINNPGTCPAAVNVNDNHPYPLMPDEAYFDNECGAGESAGDHNVENLRCPGNPGDDPCHADIFGGNSGKFLPPPPDLFSDWAWYNGDDGVFFYTSTDKTDPYIDTVLSKLEEGYRECEADTIDATGGAYNMTSDLGAAVQCPAGAKCFRVWMIIDDTGGTPQYQETGCP